MRKCQKNQINLKPAKNWIKTRMIRRNSHSRSLSRKRTTAIPWNHSSHSLKKKPKFYLIVMRNKNRVQEKLKSLNRSNRLNNKLRKNRKIKRETWEAGRRIFINVLAWNTLEWLFSCINNICMGHTKWLHRRVLPTITMANH